MVRRTMFALLGAGLAVAAPIYRRVTLDQAATAEAQQRDDTATRAVTAAEIKTSDGQCLTVDPLSGDFRENLIPIQFAACNGSENQQWDVITEGKHITNQPGSALIVSTLINGCLNFDPRRAAGDQVILFSCGGRADGDGQVTDSQLFKFDENNLGPIPLLPQNGKNAVCLTSGGQRLDQSSCDPNNAAANQLFTIGDSTAAAPGGAADENNNNSDTAAGSSDDTAASSSDDTAASSSDDTAASSSDSAALPESTDSASDSEAEPCSTVTVTVTAGAAETTSS